MNFPDWFPSNPDTWYNETFTLDIGVSLSLLYNPSYSFSFPALLSTQTRPPSSNVKLIGISISLSGVSGVSGFLLSGFPLTVAVYTLYVLLPSRATLNCWARRYLTGFTLICTNGWTNTTPNTELKLSIVILSLWGIGMLNGPLV